EVANALSAECDGAVLRGAHQEPPDMGMLAERGDESRMPVLDLLEGHTPPLVHEVDEAEIARAEDDDLAVVDVVLRALLLGIRARCLVHGESFYFVRHVDHREPGDVA